VGHGVPSYPDGAHVFLSTIDDVGRSGQDSFPSGRRGLTRRPLHPYEGVGRSHPQLPGATPGGRLLTGDLLDFLEGCDRRPRGPTREGRARQSSLAGVRRGGALSQVSSVVGPLLQGSGVKRDGVLLEEVGRFLHAGLLGPFGRYPRPDCFVPSYVISWFSYSGKPNLGYLLPSSLIVAPDPPRGCLEPRGGGVPFPQWAHRWRTQIVCPLSCLWVCASAPTRSSPRASERIRDSLRGFCGQLRFLDVTGCCGVWSNGCA